jgi:hypothetical protein
MLLAADTYRRSPGSSARFAVRPDELSRRNNPSRGIVALDRDHFSRARML